MFSLFKKRKIEGFIGMYGLEQWWLKELNESGGGTEVMMIL